ncbi:MAG: tetratricopeptide repeat protein [Gemmataceae bacterium]
MRKLAWSVVLVALAAPLAEAPGQGFVAGFGYSRGRFRAGLGFLCGPMYCRGPGPFPRWGPPCPPWVRPVTFVSIVAPPPPPTIVLPPPPAPPPEVVEPVQPPAPPRSPTRHREEAKKKPERGTEGAQASRRQGRPGRRHSAALGREAFRLGEYGRATQRFREAARLLGRDGPPYFLLAQSLAAQGKYHQAFDALQGGLARRPDWPASGFRLVELYDDVLEYSDHLQTLEEAAARHPADPELQFVYGYALWFDGRLDEASAAFRRALPRAADTGVIDLFLRTLPPGETL